MSLWIVVVVAPFVVVVVPFVVPFAVPLVVVVAAADPSRSVAAQA